MWIAGASWSSRELCLLSHAPFVRQDRWVLRSRYSHRDVAPSTREGQSTCGTPKTWHTVTLDDRSLLCIYVWYTWNKTLLSNAGCHATRHSERLYSCTLDSMLTGVNSYVLPICITDLFKFDILQALETFHIDLAGYTKGPFYSSSSELISLILLLKINLSP